MTPASQSEGAWSVARLDAARQRRAQTFNGRLTAVDVDDLLSKPAPAIDWLWNGYLERGTIGLLHGHGGAGKSLLVGGLIRAAASAQAFLDRETHRSRTVVIDAENPLPELHRRLARLGVRDVAERVSLYLADAPFLDDLASADDALISLVHTHLAELLVIDSQRAAWSGDEIDAGAVRRLYAALRRVANATGVAVLIVHHDNRGGRFAGSSDINAGPDSRMHLIREGRSILLRHEKLRSAPPQPELRYRIHLEGERYAFTRLDREPSETGRDVRADALALLADGDPRVSTEIASALNVRRREVEQALHSARADGLVELRTRVPGRHPTAKCWEVVQAPGTTSDNLGQPTLAEVVPPRPALRDGAQGQPGAKVDPDGGSEP